MPYSCADFASNFVNHLFNNGLIPPGVAESDDLEFQATEAMAVISDLVERASASPAQATSSEKATGAAQRQARSTQFMTELLDGHETLTGLGEHQGMHTLADCMYLLSAIQKGTSISVEYPSESQVADVVKSLPSGALWMTYVHEVTE
jgi:hypothetical protein